MEDVLIVFIVFGFITLFCSGIYKLIRAKMDSTDINEETFDRLAKAFIEHKKDSTRRIQHLEAIISDDNSSIEDENNKIEENTSSTIELEDENQQKSSTENSSNLRNMLHEE